MLDRYLCDDPETLAQRVPVRSMHGLTGIALLYAGIASKSSGHRMRENAHAVLRFVDAAWDRLEGYPGEEEHDVGASVWHSRRGLYYAFGRIAETETAFREAWTRFHLHAPVQTDAADVAFGTAGILLATLSLRALARKNGWEADGDPARRYAERLETQIDLAAPLHASRHTRLGTAHGWSGFLHALLAYEQQSEAPSEERRTLLRARLEEMLAGISRSETTGMTWDETLPGSWCNGSPGAVYLLARAVEVYGEAFREPLFLTAYNAALFAGRSAPSVCCGFAGAAYALGRVYRLTGEARWYDRAVALADVAVRAASAIEPSSPIHDSFIQGIPGILMLQHDVADPSTLRMPLYDELDA